MKVFFRPRRPFGHGSFTCAVAAVCGFVLGGQALAATPVFVDTSGSCAGLSPCFTTIQAGVNNAGPPPAIVNVFPGTYAESVDLSTMGSAIAGSPGTLVMQTVDATGVPTPGTVDVTPATGAAFQMSVSPFTGDLTLFGFTVQSPDDDGIGLSTVQGTLRLRNIVSDGNAGLGLSAGITAGDVHIADSSFSNNLGGDGINFGTATDVFFEHVNANGNADDGASFGVTGEVRISDSTFSNNVAGTGLSFGTATDVTFNGVTANGNGMSGASFGNTGAARVSFSTFSNNKDGDGISFGTATDVTFVGVTADGNSKAGASFGVNGEVWITDSSFDDNKDGDGLNFGTATGVTLDGVTANRNAGDGASFGANGAVRITDSEFNDNKDGNGLSFGTVTDVILFRVTAEGNKGSGANFAANGNVDIADSSFSGNTDGSGLRFSAANLRLTGTTASDNSEDGLEASVANATITASRFERNGETGVLLSTTDGGSAVIRCNDIAGNAKGLEVSVSFGEIRAEENFWGDPSGPTNASNPGGTGDTVEGTENFVPFLTRSAWETGSCLARPVPALGWKMLALLLSALFVLPAWRLSRSVSGA